MWGKRQSLETILKRAKSMQSTILKRRLEKEGTGRVFNIAFKVSLSERELINRLKKTVPEFNLYSLFKDALIKEQNRVGQLLEVRNLNKSAILNDTGKEVKEKMGCVIQLRIGLTDKKIIDKLKGANPKFKLSRFFREILKQNIDACSSSLAFEEVADKK